MSIELVMPSNHLIFCHRLLPPSIFPSIGVFSDESVLHIRWPKYWSFSFNISPSNEYSGPISFRMDWLDLLAVRGTLKSLLQHHNRANAQYTSVTYLEFPGISALQRRFTKHLKIHNLTEFFLKSLRLQSSWSHFYFMGEGN